MGAKGWRTFKRTIRNFAFRICENPKVRQFKGGRGEVPPDARTRENWGVTKPIMQSEPDAPVKARTRARARPAATRNNPFLSPPSFPNLVLHSLLFLNRGFTWPRVCPAVITCIMRGAVGLRKKGLIDGPRRRGAAEGSPPSSVGPRRGENAFAEQTGRRDVN